VRLYPGEKCSFSAYIKFLEAYSLRRIMLLRFATRLEAIAKHYEAKTLRRTDSSFFNWANAIRPYEPLAFALFLALFLLLA
jgi:hypothetical protein